MRFRRQLLGRPPSWPEIAVAVIVTVLWVPLKLAEPTVSSWPGAVVGFIMAGLVGPYTGSQLEMRVTSWFEGGVVRRWTVWLGMVIGLVAIGLTVVPAAVALGITEGFLFGLAVVFWLQLLAFRTVVEHTTL